MAQLKFLLSLLILLVAVAFSDYSYAQHKRSQFTQSYYRCQIVSDAYIKEDGALDLLREGPRIGQQFTVIKNTGQVIGDIVDGLSNPKVVALGGEKNPYKVIWEQKSAIKNGVFVDYLSIDETANANKKPFGFFSGSLFFSGFCEYQE
jgi:hypothetical protein